MNETTTSRRGKRRRPRTGEVGFPVRGFPVTLKRRIAAVADREGVSFQDVAVAALADAYGIPYEQTGRKSPGVTDSDYVELTMPRRLRIRLNEQAARREIPARQLLLSILSERFPTR
jgi:hypothetical protein